MDQKKVVDFLGIQLNNLTAEEILDHVDQCIAQRKICQIVGVNVDQALRVIENPVSKKYLRMRKSYLQMENRSFGWQNG